MESRQVFMEELLQLPRRNPAGHKSDFGHLLSVCGCLHYPGAAVLAARGAVRCGVGLVTAAFPLAAYPAIAPQATETPLLPLPSNRAGTLRLAALPALKQALFGKQALLLGCGLGFNADTIALTETMIADCVCPAVLDADGLNAAAVGICAGDAHIHFLRKAQAPLVLTPHPGEMARLTGMNVSEIQQNRTQVALDFARENGVVLVLKGEKTVVADADGGRYYRNTTGNDGMAKGGSGDLLAGMLASFLAQGMVPFAAACFAVYLHGLAGDRAAARLSRRGMTPHDCMAELPMLLSDFEAGDGTRYENPEKKANSVRI
ncbi:MAG: NAD(P)H-hydrate dehydratase [Oscillospiraceae bacterium]|jgi:NAD(P)H-hydrate epimerase|nr:NAD(P)H-hydrate dehydratase [Oscillospiraceae bacterium]